MLMVMIILYTVYFVNCIVLVFFILIQQTKGGGLAGAFGGGGGSDTFFGYTSMQKIGHYTIYAAVSFMVLSLLIANLPFKAKTPSVVDFSTMPAGVQQPFEPMAPGDESALPPVEGAVDSGQVPATDSGQVPAADSGQVPATDSGQVPATDSDQAPAPDVAD